MKNFFLGKPFHAMILVAVVLAVSFASLASAQAPREPLPGPGNSSGTVREAPTTGIETVEGVLRLVQRIFNIFFWFLILAASIFLLMAAWNYVTASGDPEKIKSANRQVTYAAVGVAVAVLARAVPQVTCNFLVSDGQSCQLQL